MSVDALCRQEAVELVSRSPKYWAMVLSFYMKGLKGALPAKVFRAAYFFCRHIDDVLDGDRTDFDGAPVEYVEAILTAMEEDEGGPSIVELYRFSVKHLVDMAKDDEEPKQHFERVIRDAMLFDHERGKERWILSREELEQYYRDTFEPVMDLALMIAGSELRAANMPESVRTQGHLYSIRDIDDDLSKGIINIPKEELEQSGLDLNEPFTGDDVRNDPHLRSWILKEIQVYEKELKTWAQKLTDEPSRQVSSLLIKQMQMSCLLQRWRLRS